MRLVQHPLLQRRDGGEAERPDEHDGDRGEDLVVGGEGEQREHQGEAPEGDVEQRHQPPVREPAAEQVAEEHPDAEQHQQPGHRAVRVAGHVGHHRGDVGDRGEDAAEAEHGHRHRQQHLGVAEGGQLAAQVGALGAGLLRDEPGDPGHADQAERGDDHEGGPPADGLPDVRAERDADDVGDGESGEHGGDGAGLLARGHQFGGDDGADAEERAVGERGDHPAGEHRPEGGGGGGQHVADHEQAHQQHQHPLAADLGAEHGEQRRAEDHAEGVAGDQQARGRDGDAVVGGDLGQQAHDHEFGGADAEGADGQSEQCEWHWARPSCDCLSELLACLHNSCRRAITANAGCRCNLDVSWRKSWSGGA